MTAGSSGNLREERALIKTPAGLGYVGQVQADINYGFGNVNVIYFYLIFISHRNPCE